jgi:hypothetical protein
MTHELCRRLFTEFRWSIGGRPQSNGFLLRGLQVRILLGSPMISMGCAFYSRKIRVPPCIEENPLISGFPVWYRAVHGTRTVHPRFSFRSHVARVLPSPFSCRIIRLQAGLPSWLGSQILSRWTSRRPMLTLAASLRSDLFINWTRRTGGGQIVEAPRPSVSALCSTPA